MILIKILWCQSYFLVSLNKFLTFQTAASAADDAAEGAPPADGAADEGEAPAGDMETD